MPWVSPLTEAVYVFPHLFVLGLPSLAAHEEMVTGLLLAPAAPPAPVRRRPADLVAQVVSRCCEARQELVVATSEGLASVPNPPSELSAFRRPAAAAAVDLVPSRLFTLTDLASVAILVV